MTGQGHIAVVGGGVIGASWASLFTAAGHPVVAYDPAGDAEADMRAYSARARETLIDLGLPRAAEPAPMRFAGSAAEAVRGAYFIQESVPERLEIKQALYAEVEPEVGPEAVFSSSTSGLMLSDLQAGWKDPSRLLIGHPFNPPHLIPLVELLANERTAPDVLEKAEALYAACGKVTIRLNKEVPGHVANRLQAALWREAIDLVRQGVASVEDLDKAIWAGPGLRWAAMGPHMLFHLGAGDKGLEVFCERLSPAFHSWWASMRDLPLDGETVATLAKGVAEAQGDRSMEALMAERDALILAMLKNTKSLREDG
ncbi:MAG: 3-hydroxyacyl-CoA dehydrogenase NAD-binding domain-containing protein [Alphaproteobacteria bacterium]|nr:3-hydroxyacyl-CoA dehydrogenase NAD-binding domain-containing protein [Alphaproteobacteria bacterium]